MSRKVVGRQGSAFLVVLDDSLSSRDAIAVAIEDGLVRGGSAPLQSFLARGYWEPYHPGPDEAAAILRAVPTAPPVAVHVGDPRRFDL